MLSGDVNTGVTSPFLEARHFYSGFEFAHDTYNAISCASNGKIYYILSSERFDKGGQFYVYDPRKDQIEFIADLTEICGEKNLGTIPQGKSHVHFYERKGKLYFSTHVGYYELIEGMDRLPKNSPNGYKAYPGGHFLSYDLTTGEIKDLAKVPDGEGMVSMTMDTERAHLYGITWPTGNFIHYDLDNSQLYDLGPISGRGEDGTQGKDFRTLCRSLFVDPRDGNVYFSTAEGDIYTYNPLSLAIEKMDDVNLRIDYFGNYDPTMPGSMGYNWRKIFWYAPEGVAYGVHGNSGYLFKFDPREKYIEIVERITSEPSKKCGRFDQFSYGYLGFQMGQDQETIYYLTGGPIYEGGKLINGVEKIAKGAARGEENLHLITFHIPSRKYTDHGPIFYPDGNRPTYVNSLAIGQDHHLYTLARFKYQGKIIQDLVKIPDPLHYI